MARAFADIAFTSSVRQQQERMGSAHYARLLSDDYFGGDVLGPSERDFIESIDGFYQATTSDTGWPYVQFRGGAPGFLRVLDDQTIAYADLRGNRQYISLGNMTQDDRVSLILMDYANARRLKIWGHAKVYETDEELRVSADTPPERLITIRVAAFDWNCPRHIPRRLTDSEAAEKVAALELENAALRRQLRTRVTNSPA